MNPINRRNFLSGASALGVGMLAHGIPLQGNGGARAEMPPHTYKYRIAFNAWVNDVRDKEVPYENWPLPNLDDEAVESNIANFDLLAKTGYNSVDIFGLLATYAWPVDINSVVDKERRRRVNLILDAAHKRGLKVVYGMGVYSWGFDEIIKHDPAVQGDNRHAMCAAKKESWEWQRKLFDYILNEFDFDGFHLEPSDQGRCKDQYCKHWGDVEYYSRITRMCADYLRTKRPKAWVTAILIGWGTWGKDFTDEEKGHLVELSKSVDCIFDQGHAQPYIPADKRREFIQRLRCDYGTSGGLWVYAPQRWERNRWFLPYPIRTGTHIRELYQDGGRGLMYYQGPLQNASTELNTAFGGRIMADPNKSIDDALAESIDLLYRPRNSTARRSLAEIVKRAENLYFDQWDNERITAFRKRPQPGELHLTTLFGASPGAASYLLEPFLDADGRLKYKDGLISILKDIQGIARDFDDQGRIGRIKEGITQALVDINNIATAKGEKQVWDDQHIGRQF